MHTHIEGIEKYGALLEETNNINFVGEILDYLREKTLGDFFIPELSMFTFLKGMLITAGAYH
ncbi:MAG: hypothetical protein QXU18_07655 [Thermoplasmatales archaeon]